MSSSTKTNNLSDREMIITRHIKAPRDLVWEAWTDVKHLSVWWGPNGFSTSTSAFSFKPGGIWQFIMHGPDGRDYPNRIEYMKIEKPSRLEYRHVAADGSGLEIFASAVTFETKDGGTLLTLRTLFPTAEGLAFVKREHKAEEGGNQTLGRLAHYVETTNTAIATGAPG